MSNRVHFTLRIEGMTCEGCARHVTLKGVPRALGVDVRLGHEVKAVRCSGDGFEVDVQGSDGLVTIEADLAVHMTAFNACNGQNECKGRGYLNVPKKECYATGGVPLKGSEGDPAGTGS